MYICIVWIQPKRTDLYRTKLYAGAVERATMAVCTLQCPRLNARVAIPWFDYLLSPLSDPLYVYILTKAAAQCRKLATVLKIHPFRTGVQRAHVPEASTLYIRWHWRNSAAILWVKLSWMFLTVIPLKYALSVSWWSQGHWLRSLDSISFEQCTKSSPINSTHYVMLYPMAIDSVT